LNALNAPSAKNTPKKKLIFIVGPTASGKTQLALQIANLLPVEAIVCDSMQVYKGMPILSQAPSAQDIEKLPHHLNQIKDLSEEFNVSVLIEECENIIQDIHERNKVPLIIGGTGLYYTSLMDGLCDAPAENPEFRQELSEKARLEGKEVLHEELMQKDPEIAGSLHVNDTKRIIRALEVIHFTGKKFSEIRPNREGLANHYDVCVYGLNWPRETLYQRINDRVDEMIACGAIQEAEAMMKKKLSKTASQCLGFREFKSYLEGKCSLEEASDELKMNTRRFAKRQGTWFRRDERIEWMDMQNTSFEKAAQMLLARLQV